MAFVKAYTGDRTGTSTLEDVRAYFAEQEKKRQRGSLGARAARRTLAGYRRLLAAVAALLGSLRGRRVSLPALRTGRIRGRRSLTTVLVSFLVLLVGTAAWAFWTSAGAGAGAGTTGTLNAPTGTTVSSVAGSGTVSVSWTAPTGGVAPTGYKVSRTGSSGTTSACGTGTTPVTTLSCSDTSVPDGTYTYAVTAVRGSWTGQGANSGSVTVTNTVSTTTSVSSSNLSAVVGQTVTYTATVTQGSGTTSPPGTVTFKDGGSAITCTGGNQTLSSGSATCTISYTAPGTHTITASYPGSGVFTASNSGSIAQTVTAASTTTTLTSSTNPSVSGQTVTFTATVSTTAPGTGTPTGTVSFTNGGTAITCAGGTQNQSLDGLGQATCDVPLSTVGSSTIVAKYAGTTNYLTSTSSGLNQTVNQASTTTSVTSSGLLSKTGQSVTYTATVSAVSPGAGTPTGTVTFKDGTSTISCTGGNQTLSGGVATCSLAYASVGSHTITAVYPTTTSFTGSTSGSITQSVTIASTTTTISSGTNPSVVGQAVTYTATVAAVSPGAGTPTGNVAFKDGGTNISGCGAQGLNASGVATCQVTYSAVNAGKTISAAYAGTTDYATSSTTTNVTQVVNTASTTTTLANPTAPGKTGSGVTYTATVAAVSPGTGTPTGQVAFKDGGTPITGCGTQAVNGSGVATCSVTYSSTGSHTITAVYAGDGNYATSTATSITQRVVNSAVTGIGFTNVAAGGSSVTLNSSNCTGLGTANVVCTISAGNSAALGADVQFVNASNALTPYSVDAVQATTAIETKNGTTAGTETFAATGSGSPRLAGAKTGNDHVYFTVTFSDGANTFTATLKMN